MRTAAAVLCGDRELLLFCVGLESCCPYCGACRGVVSEGEAPAAAPAVSPQVAAATERAQVRAALGAGAAGRVATCQVSNGRPIAPILWHYARASQLHSWLSASPLSFNCSLLQRPLLEAVVAALAAAQKSK